MALDFPSSPTNGQVYGTYTYDSVVGVWRTTPDVASGMPAGTIVQWPGATAPANWMIADGSAISRTTYASLFSAIGVTYGAGDGTTTFNLPNLKGRVVAGLDSSQTEFNTLGEEGGAKTHTLTTAEIPSHTHVNTLSSNTVASSGHNHGLAAGYALIGAGTSLVGREKTVPSWTFNKVHGSSGSGSGTYTLATELAGTTDGPSATTTVGITNAPAGTGGAHNNLQPYIVLNYIIKLSAGITAGDSELATRVGATESRLNVSPSSPNYVINGALDYWQRSTSAAQAGNSSGLPSADRIRVISSGASSPAITLARSTDVPAGIGAQYSAAMSWSSNISAGDVILHHGIENGKFLFAGKTITVSFYAKAATAIQSKFDFDQDYNETFFNLTTSWARYSYTVTLPSTYATSRPGASAQNDNVEMRFIRFTSISSASNTIYFTGLQVEEGSFATAFRRSAPSLQAELASCQRYYYKSANAYGYYNIFNSGNMQSSSFMFPVTMRSTTPTITVYDNAGAINKITIANANGSSQNTITPPTSMQVTANSFMWVAGGMGGTPGSNGMVYMNSFTAEAEI